MSRLQEIDRFIIRPLLTGDHRGITPIINFSIFYRPDRIGKVFLLSAQLIRYLSTSKKLLQLAHLVP